MKKDELHLKDHELRRKMLKEGGHESIFTVQVRKYKENTFTLMEKHIIISDDENYHYADDAQGWFLSLVDKITEGVYEGGKENPNA